jgi:hypothetical protein
MRHDYLTPKDYREAVIAVLEKADTGLTAESIQFMFGRVPGSKLTVAAWMCEWTKRGWFVSEGMRQNRVFRSSGKRHAPARASSFASVGRDTLRVASVWHFAQRAAI